MYHIIYKYIECEQNDLTGVTIRVRYVTNIGSNGIYLVHIIYKYT